MTWLTPRSADRAACMDEGEAAPRPVLPYVSLVTDRYEPDSGNG